MRRSRRLPCLIVSALLTSLLLLGLHYGSAVITGQSESTEDVEWISSSTSWTERKICKWLGICGATHLDSALWTSKPYWLGRTHDEWWNRGVFSEQVDQEVDLEEFWKDATADPTKWSKEEKILREIPKYVVEYAPYVHLYSGEQFWPCDIADHLTHTTPHLNYTPIQARSKHPNLTTLDDLNQYSRFVYLQSNDNVEDRPLWLGGKTNIPQIPSPNGTDRDGNDDNDVNMEDDEDEDEDDGWMDLSIVDESKTKVVKNEKNADTNKSAGTKPKDRKELRRRRTRRSKSKWRRSLDARTGGRSDAPAILIVVDKGNGVVDAFWFYFYSYNLGNVVLNVRFGNHVGDWEHTMVRFKNGTPKAMFFSEHDFGAAFTYKAVEKIGKRVCVNPATIKSPFMGSMLTSHYSQWHILQLDRTQTMLRLVCTHMFFPWVCCTMSQTVGRCGTLLSTFMATPTTLRTIPSVPAT